MSNFSERLTEALEARGMGQNELARRIGVPHSYISNIMRGVIKKPRKHIVSICNILRISEDWLVYGEGEPDGSGEIAAGQAINVYAIDGDGSKRFLREVVIPGLPISGDVIGYTVDHSENFEPGSLIIVKKKTGSGLFLSQYKGELFLTQRYDLMTRIEWRHQTLQDVDLNELEVIGFVCSIFNHGDW
ncbi:helix-turn-helix domain-containing protein [Dongshaea marina]|uniref:helix-turn-helix domain-containing protein n=1 Tax=Dongshaea marina TaxID=2047966 RepID=UPI00131F462F|nr:helix-turn-helix transcriptional regulator [Dongshaea marina]